MSWTGNSKTTSAGLSAHNFFSFALILIYFLLNIISKMLSIFSVCLCPIQFVLQCVRSFSLLYKIHETTTESITHMMFAINFQCIRCNNLASHQHSHRRDEDFQGIQIKINMFVAFIAIVFIFFLVGFVFLLLDVQ